MIFHAKAVEMLTVAYRNLLDIDVENDLEEFRNTFTQSNMPSHEGSRQSLNTTGTSGKDSYENMYGSGSVGGGSAPNTPGRYRPGYPASSSSAGGAGATNRSRSNEVLDRRGGANTDNFGSGGGGMRVGGPGNNGGAVRQLAAVTGPNRKNTQYNSAPNLNRAQNEMEVEDLTDDSDAE